MKYLIDFSEFTLENNNKKYQGDFIKSLNNIKIDIIVLQDHGFGCNWNGQTFGFNKNQQQNLLYNLCKASINLPKYILLGQNTAIWPNYKQETKFEDQYDSSHKKALFTLI